MFKDVKGLWNFDYKVEERKRFKAEEMWDPTHLKDKVVTEYLANVYKKW